MARLHLATPDETTELKRAATAPAQSLAAVPGAQLAAAAPGAAQEALRAGIHPGTERWPVKTGSDDDVARVGTAVVPSTVREMGAFTRPEVLLPDTGLNADYNSKRVSPVEVTIWRVTAQVVALKMETDGDYHLVLQDDSGATMIAEVPMPDPAFVVQSSPFFADIAKARKAVDKQFSLQASSTEFAQTVNFDGQPVLVPRHSLHQSAADFPAASAAPIFLDLSATSSAPQSAEIFSMRVAPTPATVTGVGFFDRAHGASGAAPNVIEIHPVLDITFGF